MEKYLILAEIPIPVPKFGAVKGNHKEMVPVDPETTETELLKHNKELYEKDGQYFMEGHFLFVHHIFYHTADEEMAKIWLAQNESQLRNPILVKKIA